jgi:pimeloyl-ACP methyl ester carboxylesterase
MRVLWAHGLEGSPSGSKPTYLAEELGWDVLAPEMNAYGWTIAEQTRAVGDAIARDAIVGGPDLDVLMGSSYGALALANAAAVVEGNGSNTPRLVLLAPAFGLAENFRATVGEAGCREWEERGSRPYFHHGFDREVEFGWDFMQAADSMSWPEMPHPTIIIHGKSDEIVPIENSRRIAEEFDDVELIEVEDGHRMQESLHYMALAVERVLAR